MSYVHQWLRGYRVSVFNLFLNFPANPAPKRLALIPQFNQNPLELPREYEAVQASNFDFLPIAGQLGSVVDNLLNLLIDLLTAFFVNAHPTVCYNRAPGHFRHRSTSTNVELTILAHPKINASSRITPSNINVSTIPDLVCRSLYRSLSIVTSSRGILIPKRAALTDALA